MWVEIMCPFNADLRAEAANLDLAGYRPEDLDVDGRALSEGRVRFCGKNTGNEGSDRKRTGRTTTASPTAAFASPP